MEIKGVVSIFIQGIRKKKQTLILVYAGQKIAVELHKGLKALDIVIIFRELAAWLECVDSGRTIRLDNQ